MTGVERAVRLQAYKRTPPCPSINHGGDKRKLPPPQKDRSRPPSCCGPRLDRARARRGPERRPKAPAARFPRCWNSCHAFPHPRYYHAPYNRKLPTTKQHGLSCYAKLPRIIACLCLQFLPSCRRNLNGNARWRVNGWPSGAATT